jgi:nucleoside-diphosphate-sugar epimerase
MRRVLVTGATGFIGSHSLSALKDKNHEVHATWLNNRRELDGIEWHRADLLDTAAIATLMRKVRPTHLLHFAWYAVPRDYRESLENLRWCESGIHLLREFAEQGGSRAVLAGTSFEYDLRYGFLSEDLTPSLPSTFYGTCKDSFRRVALEFSDRSGLSTAWGRIFYLYGPHEPRERLVPSVILSLLRGDKARCSHGRQVRDFLYVEDVGEAFVALLDSSARGVINIGSGEPITIRSIVGEIARQLQVPGQLTSQVEFGAIEPAQGDPAIVSADMRKMREEVGWVPRWSLTDGIAETIKWWKNHEQGS